MKRIKFARPVDCPTCGATPCHQKWKPRKTVDANEMVAIGDANPVDAVHCRRCDLVFRVAHFEHDDTYLSLSHARSAAAKGFSRISTSGKQMPTTTRTLSTAKSVKRPARLSPGTRSSRMSADGTRRAKHGTRGRNDYRYEEREDGERQDD